jgi:ankyrin repeat protein
VVAALLEAGADHSSSAADAQGETALQAARSSRNERCVGLLEEAAATAAAANVARGAATGGGGGVDGVEDDERGGGGVACDGGGVQRHSRRVANVEPADRDAIRDAVLADDPRALAAALDTPSSSSDTSEDPAGPDCNKPPPPPIPIPIPIHVDVPLDGAGRTALLLAARRGRIEVLRFCLRRGADANRRGAEGRVECVRALVGAGADRRVASAFGQTPLAAARRRANNEELVELLLRGKNTTVKRAADVFKSSSLQVKAAPARALTPPPPPPPPPPPTREPDHTERRKGIKGARSGDLDAITAMLDGKLAGGGGKLRRHEQNGLKRAVPAPPTTTTGGSDPANGGGGDENLDVDEDLQDDVDDEVEFKVDIDAPVGDDGGETLLAIAAGAGKADVVKELLARGATVGLALPRGVRLVTQTVLAVIINRCFDCKINGAITNQNKVPTNPTRRWTRRTRAGAPRCGAPRGRAARPPPRPSSPWVRT